MSLEAKIEALTAAVEANTAMLKGIAAAGKANGAAAAASTTKATGAGKKGATQEDVAAAVGEYLKTSDKAELKRRIANVKKLNAHFEVEKITDADPSKFKEILGMVAKLEKGEDPFPEEEEDEDDTGSLV